MQQSLISDKLTTNLYSVLDGYLLPLYPQIPKESLLLDILVAFGRIVAHKRVRVSYLEANTLINLYTLVFMPSGVGKDIGLKRLEGAFYEPFRRQHDRLQEDYFKRKTEELDAILGEKFEKSNAAKELYREQHKPRQLLLEMSDATPEGFYAAREAYSDADFGATYVKIPEFGDYITTDNDNRRDFISMVTDVFDDGNSEPKAIKGEKFYKSIRGVPNLIRFHTSASGLLTGMPHKRLLTLFGRGFGRRAFVCYPSSAALVLLEESERENVINNALLAESAIRDFVVAPLLGTLYPTYHLDKTAQSRYYSYINECRTNGANLLDTELEGLIAEVTNRHWKVLKLAGLIAVIEHPNRPTVEIDDIECAIYLGDLFGDHMRTFFESKELSPTDHLRSIILQNKNKWVTKTEVRAKGLVAANTFTKWFADSIDAIAEWAEENNYELLETQNGSRGRKYKLIDKPRTPAEREAYMDLL